jgi:hypothetical protein
MADNEQVVSLLEQILLWLRFQNRQYLRTLLSEILSTKADRQIYELSDGRSQPEIAKQAGVSQPTVSLRWKNWRSLGVVYELPEQQGRCRHLASLHSLGLDFDNKEMMP